MKRIIFGVLVLMSLAATAGNYDIDPAHSFVNFKINHLGMGNVWGQFKEISGSFDLDEGQLQFEVKTESVSTHNEKRDQHLRSPDFFNVKQFPVIQFKSQSVKALGKGKYQVKGELSLHGITQSIQVEVTLLGQGKDPWGNQRAGIEVNFSVKRSDYGMNYMAEALGDEVQIFFNGEGIQK